MKPHVYVVLGLSGGILAGCTIEEKRQVILPHPHVIVTPPPETPPPPPPPSTIIIEKKRSGEK